MRRDFREKYPGYSFANKILSAGIKPLDMLETVSDTELPMAAPSGDDQDEAERPSVLRDRQLIRQQEMEIVPASIRENAELRSRLARKFKRYMFPVKLDKCIGVAMHQRDEDDFVEYIRHYNITMDVQRGGEDRH